MARVLSPGIVSLHNNDEIVGKRPKDYCHKEYECMGNDSVVAGEPVVLFCVKNIAMGELEISVEGSCRLGVGGAPSCSMVLLWPNGEASNAKDFAPQWGFLEKGCTLPATWRRQRPIYIYARWGC